MGRGSLGTRSMGLRLWVPAFVWVLSCGSHRTADGQVPTLSTEVAATLQLAGGEECLAGKRSMATSVSGYSAARASGASAGFDATYYRLDLRLISAGSTRIAGTTRIEGRVLTPILTSLELDLDDAMRVTGVRLADGTPVGYTHSKNVLSVMLPAPAGSGALVAVEVDYGGTPRGGGFKSFAGGTLANGDPYIYSLSEPYFAREWWPCKDYPADKADSVDVVITVPDPMRVGSNGMLVDAKSNGDGTTTWTWKHRYPISTYLVSIAGGVFDVDEQTYRRPDSLASRYGPLDLPILHYAYAGSRAFEGSSDGSEPTQGWKRVTDILPIFEDWFGPYPFSNEKYGHAHFGWGGAMEHQTMTSMTSSYVGTVAHELAHQWYGDSVGPASWRDLWLNEGFATFSELVWWKARADVYPGLYEEVFDIYYRRSRAAIGTVVLEDTSDAVAMFDGAKVYAKGGIVLHMLRSIVGDEVMRTILESWAARPETRYRTATTEDFVNHVNQVTGLDFTTFFRQWVTEGNGYPAYAAEWSSRTTQDGYEAVVRLRQTQTEAISDVYVFVMPVELEFATTGGSIRVKVEQTTRVQDFVIPLALRPIGLTVDPDRKILRSADVVVTAMSRPPDLPSKTRFGFLYPSPAVDRVHMTIEFAGDAVLTLDIFDARGRRVSTRRLDYRGAPVESETLDVSALATGVYFARLQGERASDTRTFVVRRGAR